MFMVLVSLAFWEWSLYEVCVSVMDESLLHFTLRN